MKTNLFLKLSIIFLINVFLLKAQVPTPDILHYKFGPSSTTVSNVASSPPVGSTTGTLLGSITQTGNVNCMGALVGSGITSTSDYINTGWATSLPGSWSISFWTSNIQPSATLYYIFGDVNAGGFRCFTNGVAGPNNWILRGTGLTDILITGAATPSANMVTFIYDQAAATSYGYINGVLTTTVSQPAAPTISGSGPFKVGGYSANTGLNLGGLMADYRIYGSALTATQVAAIYAATSPSFITVSVAGNTAVCTGQSSTLTASGATTYSWNTSAATNSIVVTPTATSNYSVIGTAGTCTSQSVYTVNVNPLPNVTVNNPTICLGQSATLTASGATTYSWSNAASSASISVAPTTNTTYVVVGTNSNACVNSATATVSVNANPTVSVAGASTVCSGGSVALTASGANTYSWNTAATTASISVTPTANISYTVVGTNTAGCSSSAVKSLTVNASPTVSVAGASTVCSGGSVALTASGANTYSWNTAATTASISVTPTANISYTVVGTNTAGCSSSAVKSLTVNASPTVSVAGASTVCSGGSVALTASGANTYSWNTTATTASISVTPTANISYTVVGTNTAGCSSSAVKSLTVNANPTVSIVSSASLICVGQSASLTPSGASTYTITGGSLVISPTVTTSYTVNGTAANGCQGSSTITQNVSPCTGINTITSIQHSRLNVYPNPTNEVLHIQLELINGDNTSLELVNALGQAIVSKNVSQEVSSFNVTSLTSGIYFVKLIQNGKVIDVKKVVKN